MVEKNTAVEKAKMGLSKEQQTYSSALTLAFSKATNIVLDPKRLISLFYSQCQKNPKLSRCTIPSVVVSILACAELGLEPGAKAYLIPYENNKTGTTECHFQIGYKGLIDLFYRHPSAAKIEVQTVHKGDVFEFEYGTNSFIKHIPSQVSEPEVLAYYAVAKLKNESVFKVMFPDEIRKHGLRYSKMIDKETQDFKYNSLWKTDFDSMAKKTVIIQLMKTLPYVSQEIEHALEADRVDRRYDERFKSVFDMPKEEDVIEAEGAVVEEGSATSLPAEQGKSSVPSAPKKLDEEVKKIQVKKEEDNLFDAESKKKSTLNFLIAYMKSQGVKIEEEYYNPLPIDEAIAELEKAKKDLPKI